MVMAQSPLLPTWIDRDACSLDDFRAAIDRETTRDDVPLAAAITANIPVYDGDAVRAAAADDPKPLMAEWNAVFDTGPGIVAITNALDDHDTIDRVSSVLRAVADREKDAAAGGGDHFAAAGANIRIWNAHEKLCMASPEAFARYNSNPVIPMVSRAWLGPAYQVTTQVNIVRPGGKAQTCHRDYHMGFMAEDQLTAYPLSAHRISAALTLQGAIAHGDMPVASGPTKLLPYSQTYATGYIAALLPAFRDLFEERFVQLELAKGDAVFFNPATFHAAGENRTTKVERFANLLQIGSGFGRSIEIVNRTSMCIALYPTLAALKDTGDLTADEIDNVVAACAEGYPFPVNLDVDSPLTGMAPPSQQDLMRQALAETWPAERLASEVRAQADLRRVN